MSSYQEQHTYLRQYSLVLDLVDEQPNNLPIKQNKKILKIKKVIEIIKKTLSSNTTVSTQSFMAHVNALLQPYTVYLPCGLFTRYGLTTEVCGSTNTKAAVEPQII